MLFKGSGLTKRDCLAPASSTHTKNSPEEPPPDSLRQRLTVTCKHRSIYGSMIHSKPRNVLPKRPERSEWKFGGGRLRKSRTAVGTERTVAHRMYQNGYTCC